MLKRSQNNFILLLFVCLSFLFSCYQRETTITEKDNPDADTILSYYNVLLHAGHHKQAIKYLDSANQKLTYVSTANLWKIYKDKHLYYLDFQRNLAKSGSYLDSMELILSKSSLAHPSEYVQTFFARGDLFFTEKRYTEAFKSYYDGRQFAIKNLDSCRLSEFTSQLAHIKFRQLKFADAIAYLKISLTESRVCSSANNFHNRFVTVQSKFNTIGVAYERMGNLDSAISYYQKGLKFITTYQTLNRDQAVYVQRAYGVICGNLGGVYLKKGNFEQAQLLLKKSIAINDRESYEVKDAKTAKSKLADLYLKTNRFKQGNELLQQLIGELENEPNKNASQTDLLLQCYQVLKAYGEQKGITALAYTNIRKYYLLKDSIDKMNATYNAADMDMAFELNAQKYRTTFLEKDNKLKTAYLIGISLFFAITICFLVFFYTNLKKMRRYVEKLKCLNYQNEQTLAALEQSKADNNRILQIVAHDLRNPLSGIIGVVALMLEEDGFSEESKAELALIRDTGENSLALVNELLQINFNLKDLKMDVIDIDELIQYCAELLKHKAETKQQQIIVHSFAVNVIANREKIWRVLSNLIGNAIKFSRKESDIKISMEKKKGYVVVAISDEGIGIPSHMATHLFDLFTPAKRDGTAGEQSFGMGLSIAKQIIEAHGGAIWFDSRIDEGTTFYFSLSTIA